MKSSSWEGRIAGRPVLLWVRCGSARVAAVVEDDEPELLLSRISQAPFPEYRYRGGAFVNVRSLGSSDPYLWCNLNGKHRDGHKGHYVSLSKIADAVSRGRKSLGVADIAAESPRP